MQPTERLYFTDSGILEFAANVTDVTPTDRGDEVILDQTAFYPTGGGQPHDTGRLDDAEVIDVYERDDQRIIHLVKDSGMIRAGHSVTGRIDRARRLDHMQQHSGQHILSQAFIQACGAETRSFHLGSQTSTIDIELQAPTDEIMRAAEEIANAVIFEDRPMRAHLVNEEQAAQLPLRKESAVTGTIRVIEVEGFDWSPCGGTHATRAGQVGLVAVKSYERVKKMTRVEFVCGRRALNDYQQANATAFAVARLFSAGRDATPALVEAALRENKSLKKRQRDLLELALTAEAAQILSQTPSVGDMKIVSRVFDGREGEELRILASKIVEAEPAVALLGSKDASAARLVFARSQNLTQHMGQLLAEACALLGGRGGGRPELAQGGGPQVEKLEEAMQLARAHLVSSK